MGAGRRRGALSFAARVVWWLSLMTWPPAELRGRLCRAPGALALPCFLEAKLGARGFTVKMLEELGGSNLCSELRFGRKLSVIRGIVEQEIQAMVSRRENAATHHLYQAWDPVPSLAPATTGSRGSWGGWVAWGCQPAPCAHEHSWTVPAPGWGLGRAHPPESRQGCRLGGRLVSDH